MILYGRNAMVLLLLVICIASFAICTFFPESIAFDSDKHD